MRSVTAAIFFRLVGFVGVNEDGSGGDNTINQARATELSTEFDPWPRNRCFRC